jgi:hypothetical protein
MTHSGRASNFGGAMVEGKTNDSAFGKRNIICFIYIVILLI